METAAIDQTAVVDLLHNELPPSEPFRRGQEIEERRKPRKAVDIPREDWSADRIVNAERAAKAWRLKQEEEEERRAAGLKPHEERRDALHDYYHYKFDQKIADFPVNQENVDVLTSNEALEMFTDVWDVVDVLSEIVRDDKKGSWRETIEFGLAVIFGFLLIFGSLMVAMDASFESEITCKYDKDATDPDEMVKCTKSSYHWGTTEVLKGGSWILFVSSLGIVVIILWRLAARLFEACTHHLKKRKFLRNFILNGDSEAADKLKDLSFYNVFNRRIQPRKPKNSASQYHHMPAYYAPRTAHQRVARGYGSPIMC